MTLMRGGPRYSRWIFLVTSESLRPRPRRYSRGACVLLMWLIHRGCYGTWLSVDMILATTEPSRRRPLTIHSSRNYFVPAKCGTKSVTHFASTTQFGLLPALGRMDKTGRASCRESVCQYV